MAIYVHFIVTINTLGSDDARKAFLTEYGNYDESEKLVDDVVNWACGRFFGLSYDADLRLRL